MPSASAMEDVWLMTDPVARARYEFDSSLAKLEHDIRFEVMRGEDWSPIDRSYISEARRLEQEGRIHKLASFWAVSPHPSIYRAVQSGEFNLMGNRVPFSPGDEIIWACPMTRDRFNLDLPILVGDFQDSRLQTLCGEMVNAMQGRMR